MDESEKRSEPRLPVEHGAFVIEDREARRAPLHAEPQRPRLQPLGRSDGGKDNVVAPDVGGRDRRCRPVGHLELVLDVSIGIMGEMKVVAGGAITVHNAITTNGSGRAAAAASNDMLIGVALEAAGADGEGYMEAMGEEWSSDALDAYFRRVWEK